MQMSIVSWQPGPNRQLHVPQLVRDGISNAASVSRYLPTEAICQTCTRHYLLHTRTVSGRAPCGNAEPGTLPAQQGYWGSLPYCISTHTVTRSTCLIPAAGRAESVEARHDGGP